jgi:SAM-dependent methyltransferase
MAVKPYRWLAEYYDRVFGSARVPRDAAREKLLGPIMPMVATACDLACGTGTTSVDWARAGIRTYAVDLSAGMCRLAREKSRRAGVRVRVIRADMRSFRLPEAVDLITCEYDAVNHVPRKTDLLKVVKSAARALRPGGHFFFDVNNALGFERYWKGVWWVEKPGVVMAMRSGNEGGRAWCDVEWFVQEGGLWRRHRERVEEVSWSAEEIRHALKAAGFDRVRAWDSAGFFDDPLIVRGCRTVWLARKAGSGRGSGKDEGRGAQGGSELKRCGGRFHFLAIDQYGLHGFAGVRCDADGGGFGIEFLVELGDVR